MSSNIFDQLGSIYFEIDAHLDNKIMSLSAGSTRKRQEYLEQKKRNDEAYFLYMFSRLEDRITQLSIDLLDAKELKLTEWHNKRAWSILHDKKDQLHFLQRVALLTLKGNTDYNLIKKYYDQRNNLAHGKNFTIPIVISTVITDLKRLYVDLKP